MRRTRSLGSHIPPDYIPEIEQYLHRRKREARKNQAMADARTLKEYATPSTEEPAAVIVYPDVEGNNFEIKPALLHLVQQNQFSGSPAEDPNLHISTFLRLSGTIKANQEAVRLHLFPFSLRDRASAWFHSLEKGSITSWDQIRQVFLARFFPPSKTAKYRDQITRFNQAIGESLYDAWERFKEMLRVCPHHGLEQWLIIHTFYNGLLYNTKLTVDAAAGGALMNKNYADAYALIEDMAQNHYQWTSERAIGGTTPSNKEAGIYEVSPHDHLAAKVEALSHKLNKLNVSASTPSSPISSCEVCGITGHSSDECQLGSALLFPEQINYAQYQGMSQGQNFYNKNQFGQQVAPPGYGNNQRVAQKSNLELMLENFVLNQEKQNQELKSQTRLLKESLDTLTSKVDSLAISNKSLETQISQVAQHVSSTSQTPGIFPGQPEANPKAHINVVTLENGQELEKPKVEIVQGRESLEESESPVDTKPYVPKVPLPQRLVKPNLEDKFRKFVELTQSLHTKVPKVLSQMPTYAKFVKDVISKKRIPVGNETITLTKECNALLGGPPKLGDPGSFAIPIMIGDTNVERALCDLGASVSMLPLSLFMRIGIGNLKPTDISLKLADRTIISPVGIAEDMPVLIDGCFVPADFVVVDIPEDPQVPILLGRPLLATAGAVINVREGCIMFQISGMLIGFEMYNINRGITDYSLFEAEDHGGKQCSSPPPGYHHLFDPF
jgi:hypothetical protein